MASCEKCWKDSGGNSDVYSFLLSINNCTPEEQAGEDAGVCDYCNRKTVHQYSDICMVRECTFPQHKGEKGEMSDFQKEIIRELIEQKNIIDEIQK